MPLDFPFTKTEYVTILTQVMVRLIHLLLNPIFLMISSRKIQSTQSYVLLISSLSAMNPEEPELYFCKQCNVSKATKILSEINLSLVKADWCFVTMVGRIVFSQLDKTLDKILYNTLQRLIGAKLSDIFRIFSLWNECDKSVIYKVG